MPSVFLDHQASTPILPEVFEAMQPFFFERHGNPSSLHQHGLRARDAINQAREQVAQFIHAESPGDVLFTSGGTEAVNLAVKGVAWANQRRGKHIVASAIEHPAVLNALAFLEQQGFTATRVPVDTQGFVDPEQVHGALREDTILVCLHWANYDVGTLQPLQKVSGITNERGIPLFVDAVAAAGWTAIDVQAKGIGLLALSAHRFYGPKGAGALYRHRGVRLTNLVHGGDQEGGRRAGTENVPGIAGLGKAAEVAVRELPARETHTRRLQEQLWQGIELRAREVQLNGPLPGAQRLSTNLNVSASGTEGEGQMLALDMAGVAVTSGTACVSRAVKVSPVLQAMGIDRARALASVVFTLGQENTPEEIDYTIISYVNILERLRKLSAPVFPVEMVRRT